MLNARHIVVTGLLAVTLIFTSCGKKEKPAPPAEPALSEVVVSGIPNELKVNESARLTVYSDGKEVDNPNVHWESTNASVARVNERGELEARGGGTAQITAMYKGVTSKAFRVTIKPAPPLPAPAAPAPAEPPVQGDQRRKLEKKGEKAKSVPDRIGATRPEPRRPSVPETKADVFAALDNALKETGNIAFNAPKTMNIRDTVKIQLLLSLAKTMEQLKEDLSRGGGLVGEEKGSSIQVAPRMEARLSGPNFEIVALTPEDQLISRQVNTEWQWEVKPREVGKQDLHLTLSAIMMSSKRALRTFDEVITVEVTPGQRVIDFVKDNWQWLWTAALLPLGALIWKKLRKPPDFES